MKAIVGFRPTNKLHLGHYFSVIKPALEDKTVTVLIADLHVFNTVDPRLILENTDILERFGISNNRMKVQSGVFNHEEYMEVTKRIGINTITKLPTLFDVTNLFTLMYPVKMYVDVLGYDKVYVGKDQTPHINFINNLRKDNKIEVVYTDVQIQDIRIPVLKMSKTLPKGCIFLDDSEEEIIRKMRKCDNQYLVKLAKVFDIDIIDTNRMGSEKERVGIHIFNTLNT